MGPGVSAREKPSEIPDPGEARGPVPSARLGAPTGNRKRGFGRSAGERAMAGTRGFRLASALLAGAALAALPLTAAVASVSPHGASSLQTPRVFVDFWGPEWGAGFTTGGYSSAQYQQYVVDFLHNLSTDPTPLSPLVQYGYQAGGALYSGSWEDTANDPPAEPMVDQMGAEVARAAGHFGDSGSGQDVNDIIIIAMPTQHYPAWFGSNGGPFCGYFYFSQFTF